MGKVMELSFLSVRAKREASSVSQAVADVFGSLLLSVRGVGQYAPTHGISAIDYESHFTDPQTPVPIAPPTPQAIKDVSLLSQLRRELNHAFKTLDTRHIEIWAKHRVMGLTYVELNEEGFYNGLITDALRATDSAVVEHVSVWWAHMGDVADIEDEAKLRDADMSFKLSQAILSKELRRLGFTPAMPLTVRSIDKLTCEVVDREGQVYIRSEGKEPTWTMIQENS